MPFKLVISLINYRDGVTKQLISVKRYKTKEAAQKAAKEMIYIDRDSMGHLTHECSVRIEECSFNTNRRGG
ncbi:TPA: hypothetical protein ACHGD4_000005 [Escherichia coli]|nr:hypothetical protein [Escherichia coli O146]